eukprot:6466615-Amphidinium_carterae.3
MACLRSVPRPLTHSPRQCDLQIASSHKVASTFMCTAADSRETLSQTAWTSSTSRHKAHSAAETVTSICTAKTNTSSGTTAAEPRQHMFTKAKRTSATVASTAFHNN